MPINRLTMYFQNIIQNWLMTKLYQIKHDPCYFEFIIKGMAIVGTSTSILYADAP